MQFIRLWQFGNIFPPILTGFIERVVKPLHKHIRFVLTPQSQRQEGCVFTGLFSLPGSAITFNAVLGDSEGIPNPCLRE